MNTDREEKSVEPSTEQVAAQLIDNITIDPDEVMFTQGGRRILQPNHRMWMRAIVLRGWKIRDIAEFWALNPATVSRIVNSDIFQVELAKLQARADNRTVEETVNVRRTLERLSGKSLKVMEDILDDTTMKVNHRLSIAFDVLDRTVGKAPEKKEVVVDFRDAAQRAWERRKAKIAERQETPNFINGPPAVANDLPRSEPQQYRLIGFD